MTRRIGVVGLLGVAVLLLLTSSAFAKDYKRSCQAEYSVGPTSFRGEGWSFTFSGAGKVGYFNPNEARRRARRNIDECIDAHWRSYTALRPPEECTEANLITSYPVRCLSCQIADNMCRLNPGHASIVVSITVTYAGDEGCRLRNNSWMRHIARNHLINCTGLEFEPDSNRPGMDIRSFEMPAAGNEPEDCRIACIAQTGCQSWSHARAGVLGTAARCWLKNGVPAATRSENYTSGVPSRP